MFYKRLQKGHHRDKKLNFSEKYCQGRNGLFSHDL